MKKIITTLTIILLVFLIILNINNKENKNEKQNNNISIILETEEGNIESNTFPDKDFYEFSNIVCENTNDEIVPTFNKETWKLNLNVEKKNIDGNFNCVIYFKHTPKIASEFIVSKYTENNDEGLIKLDQPETIQTPSGTEYRYSGNNNVVKNYVDFNGETWRIIGVFPVDDGTGNIESRVKIIREESIGNYSWDTSASGINDFVSVNNTQIYGGGVNQWGESGTYEGADLMRLLNPGYESESVNNSLYWNGKSGTCYNDYNNATTSCDFGSIGLTENSKSMIEDAVWYTGAGTVDGTTTAESYEEERSNTTGAQDIGITITKTSNWIGKIGLMYPSDYGYASRECYESEVFYQANRIDYMQELCTSTNWLYNSGPQWTLSATSGNRILVRRVYPVGEVGNWDAGDISGIRPTLYLSSSAKITSGTGTIDDMYHLS